MCYQRPEIGRVKVRGGGAADYPFFQSVKECKVLQLLILSGAAIGYTFSASQKISS